MCNVEYLENGLTVPRNEVTHTYIIPSTHFTPIYLLKRNESKYTWDGYLKRSQPKNPLTSEQKSTAPCICLYHGTLFNKELGKWYVVKVRSSK